MDLRWLRRTVPRNLKARLRDIVERHRLGLAIRRLETVPPGVVPPGDLLEALRAAWGNEGFGANLPFLVELAHRAVMTPGPILECGSGVTSIVLGLLAGRRGVAVHALEHDAEWFAKIAGVLGSFRIPGVRLHLSPLRNWGSLTWYEIPARDWPSEFQLVVCDGPPNTTPGGRYGLLPLVGPQLPRGSVILLDDATYPPEAQMLERWRAEQPMHVDVREAPTGEGPTKAYAVLTLDR